MAIDYKALGAKAAAEGANQTKGVAGGGGDYVPPAAGPALARLVGYFEIGKQKGKMKGVEYVKPKVQLVFELVGKRHPPSEHDGVKTPQRITITENYSLNEKANFFKLFQRMNYKQDAQHMVQLLGEGFKAEVVHDTWTDNKGKERVTAQLRNEAGYTIAPPRKEDEDSETGWVDVSVPPALTVPKGFLWDYADKEQWDGIFIEGEYPERKDDKGVVTAKAKSKNVIQDIIKQAVDFIGSPIHTLLVAGGEKIDIPSMDEQDEEDAEPAVGNVASTTPHSNDALGGIV